MSNFKWRPQIVRFCAGTKNIYEPPRSLQLYITTVATSSKSNRGLFSIRNICFSIAASNLPLISQLLNQATQY